MVMLIKKIGLIVLALLFSADIALAESGYKHKQHRKPQYHGKYVEKRHYRRHDNHRRWHGGNHNNNGNNNINGNHNYWHGGNKNYYNYNYRGGGGNRRFYNNPYFWGGVAGGIIGGAIVRDYNYFVPECETIWIEVYIPGEGYRQQQQVVCD